uniref:Protein-L-isoaspartate(D-aspartate) O-methyltransferase n=1 Tax=Corethron hystrix TaxID=216773 RepID=A0A7S1FZ34_9STRA|mmetsp:Transcript_3967/g.7580  ORF Transcript_3967/g.7580 Transcript_3967/m.7580 type:complete len:506 (+) Transcript_3967:418-1935(+)|eukprot:CAMPEP_0113303632 /NCGR_PEP_ID=MMETSP0010_2-20120614/3968_1 /TAXON_ID=216773 ORGANISM="Corethron hystrix, Strain 308" /NCGR_SAMPLE_ID=MMETSP0010_2 /ASSEMBLY_ACC=CAM_ASM_000155 /LENGTH=505 /DNA_ID=CAMNT_0000157663 /DNA_START=401 /DNA_END=1918 /DNA_ORIENTATION=+ /assembly_acc=CAM_ASM_000155
MAWRSSGISNDEMIDCLKGFGIISSPCVISALRKVDRGLFIPEDHEDLSYLDQPIKLGNIHISAPHIYGSALEALELVPNSSMSFLNVGSGTGYISCIVSQILGTHSLNVGVELQEDIIRHCKSSIDKWYESRSKNEPGAALPNIEIIHGNGLNIDDTKGQSINGFDRIYVGASINSSELVNLTKLLSRGGILVGPVDDELIKITRIPPVTCDRSSVGSNMSDKFLKLVISGVRFAPALKYPVMQTVIPSKIWSQSNHIVFPPKFQNSVIAVLLSANAKNIQKKGSSTAINLAATLPKVIWLEIIAFAHRKWFDTDATEMQYLQRCLKNERENTLVRRCHLQMESILDRSQDAIAILGSFSSNQGNSSSDTILVTGEETNAILRLREVSQDSQIHNENVTLFFEHEDGVSTAQDREYLDDESDSISFHSYVSATLDDEEGEGNEQSEEMDLVDDDEIMQSENLFEFSHALEYDSMKAPSVTVDGNEDISTNVNLCQFQPMALHLD